MPNTATVSPIASVMVGATLITSNTAVHTFVPAPTWTRGLDDMPDGRPVLLVMTHAPVGWSIGDGRTVTIGQKGEGSVAGVWTSDGFFPFVSIPGKTCADIFVAWAEVPKFDLPEPV
jgi:hypothetical protein